MGLESMKEMTKFEGWYERMGRTILSRGMELGELEMLEAGILGVVNYEAVYEDGLSMDEQAMSIVRTGRNTFPGGSILVDSTVKGGEGNDLHRVYSGIVFRDLYSMHLWMLRRRHMYVDLSRSYGLSN